MVQRRSVTLLHLGTLLFAPLICASMVGPAHAAERGARVAILPTILPGPHGHAEASDVFQSVAKSARLHLGLELVPWNQLVVEGTEPLADAVRACASDERCLGQALASHEIDVGLRAIVNFAIDPPLVSLAVVNAAPPRTLAESIVELPKGTDLDEVLQRETSTLFDRTGFPRAARIQVAVKPADAMIHVEGAREGERPGAFIVRPGTYEVVASRDGWATARRSVTVAAGEEAGVELVLEENPGMTSSPWFWAAIGVAAAAVATTTVLVATDPFSSPPANRCVCITTAAGTCPPCP